MDGKLVLVCLSSIMLYHLFSSIQLLSKKENCMFIINVILELDFFLRCSGRIQSIVANRCGAVNRSQKLKCVVEEQYLYCNLDYVCQYVTLLQSLRRTLLMQLVRISLTAVFAYECQDRMLNAVFACHRMLITAYLISKIRVCMDPLLQLLDCCDSINHFSL
jgi:hypothetical protein